MGSRKKKDPAALRTLGLFSKQTPLEEAESLVREEAAVEERPSGPRTLGEEANDSAVRWLGNDSFSEGGDVRVVEHRAGHAVLVLVNVTKAGAEYGTTNVKLSKAQWSKLKRLAAG